MRTEIHAAVLKLTAAIIFIYMSIMDNIAAFHILNHVRQRGYRTCGGWVGVWLVGITSWVAAGGRRMAELGCEGWHR